MRQLLLVSVCTASLASSAYAAGPELSFADVMAAARKAFQSDGRVALAATWAEAAASAREQTGLWRLEVEGSAEVGGQQSRIGGLGIGKTFVFGDDAGARLAAAKLEGQADLEDDRAMLFAFERELGAVYVDIGRNLALHARAEERLAALSPILTQAERATARGGGDTLALHKARLLRLKMASERDAAANGAATRSKLLKERLHLSLETFSVQPIAAVADAKAADGSPESKALRARSEALKNRDTARQGLWEMDGSFGVQRDFQGKSNAIVAKLEVPLGQGSVAERETREFQAERARLLARADAVDLVTATLRDRLEGELRLAHARHVQLVAQREELDRLLALGHKGMSQGLAGFGEVVETLAELFEVDVALADADRDAQMASIELLLVNGETP